MEPDDQPTSAIIHDWPDADHIISNPQSGVPSGPRNPQSERPLVSVIIPTYNGAAWLPGCLDALRAQTFRDFEVLVVDDASSDDTPAVLARYPEVRAIRLPQNRLFAGAANAGLAAARGELLALLNNDTAAAPGWLAALVEGLRRASWAGCAASKLVLFDDPTRFHSAGDFYGRDGVPGSRGVWQPDTGQYEQEEEVFGPCAAAALYRRAMLIDVAAAGQGPRVDGRMVGGKRRGPTLPPVFDESLGMYCEDVDLNLRARLRGWRCVYVPGAVVRHKLSATGGGPLASYYVGRNLLYLLAKDVPASLLLRNAPRIVGAQLRFLLESLVHIREQAARARLRGQLRGLLTWPRYLPARRTILAGARVDAATFGRWLR
jgi:GT2 family glycosyltransferase